MIFDKTAFNQNAETHIKKLLPKDHIDALDGMEVVFKNIKFGEVPHYIVEGEDFHLYPVPREWCSECKQLSLFGVEGGE